MSVETAATVVAIVVIGLFIAYALWHLHYHVSGQAEMDNRLDSVLGRR